MPAKPIIILAPYKLDFETNGGSNIRIAEYTKGLIRNKNAFKFFSRTKPEYINDEEFVQFGLEPRWKRILVIHNLFYFNFIGKYVAFILRVLILKNNHILNLKHSSENNIIWTHQDNSIAYFLFLVFNIRFLYDVHGILHLQKEYKDGMNFQNRVWFELRLRHEKWVFKKASYINAVSHPMKSYIEDYFSPTGLIFVAPDGIPYDLSYYENIQALDTSKKYKIIKGSKIILFAGSYKKIGGVHHLVNCFCENRDVFRNAILLLIGFGQMGNYISEQIEKYNCNDLVVMIPPMSHSRLISHYKAADLIVCPDIQNGYNKLVPHIKLFDAIASGKKVLAPDFEINKKEFQENKFNIYYYQNNDNNSLLMMLKLALNNNSRKVQKINKTKTYQYRVNQYLNELNKSNISSTENWI